MSNFFCSELEYISRLQKTHRAVRKRTFGICFPELFIKFQGVLPNSTSCWANAPLRVHPKNSFRICWIVWKICSFLYADNNCFFLIFSLICWCYKCGFWNPGNFLHRHRCSENISSKNFSSKKIKQVRRKIKKSEFWRKSWFY